MKKVLNFFSRPEEELKPARTVYVSREPTLHPQSGVNPRSSSPGARQHTRQYIPPEKPAEPKMEPIPTDYAGIVEFFHQKVRDRKSPYNALVSAAECLKEFIPDETSRLKAVLAICGDKWPRDALSLAISTHISDIEHTRLRARDNTQTQASERAAGFRRQAGQIKEQNEKIENEIRSLNDAVKKLETTLNDNRATLAKLNEQIQLAEAHANSVSFVDQAAENLKNDLLAKKVILGLP
jgi:flagellar motility protein MotE (MotC chaperone)